MEKLNPVVATLPPVNSCASRCYHKYPVRYNRKDKVTLNRVKCWLEQLTAGMVQNPLDESLREEKMYQMEMTQVSQLNLTADYKVY